MTGSVEAERGAVLGQRGCCTSGVEGRTAWGNK